jgi:S1-C subfamily serine protease
LLAAAVRAADPDPRRDAAVIAVERAMPSVVNISALEIVERHDPYEAILREFWGPFYRRRRPDTQYNLGSGVIIDEEGMVLTNHHVVARARKIWIKLADGREFEAEPIVGTTFTDLALLRIVAKPGQKFTSVKFASDDDLLLGETVLALGNPFGLGGTVTKGILSSKSRRPPTDGEPLDIQDWLQSDAAINPGNSGGPLINLRGEMIGINVAVGQGQGIGFAIPVKRVSEAVSEIYRPEIMNRDWLGIRVKAGGLPLTVTTVDATSPAERAGIKRGDQLVQLNGKPLKGFIEFNRELMKLGSTQDFALGLQRGTDRRTVTVRMVSFAELIKKKLGVSVEEVNQDRARQSGVAEYRGLMVASVERGSPAAEANLQRGMLITAIDREPVMNLESAGRILNQKKKPEAARLTMLVPRQYRNFTRLEEASINVPVK